MPARVLIFDRDQAAVSAVVDRVTRAGFAAEWAHASDVIALITGRKTDAIVIGRLPEDQCRVDLCREFRAIPISDRPALIVALPQSSTLTRVKCLEEGADRIVDAPMDPGQLIARLRGLTREHAPRSDVLRYGAIEMRVDELKVQAAGQQVALSPSIFQLLTIFLERRGEIVSRSELLARLFGQSSLCDVRAVDSAVRRLRESMACLGLTGAIVTIRSVGYMLAA